VTRASAGGVSAPMCGSCWRVMQCDPRQRGWRVSVEAAAIGLCCPAALSGFRTCVRPAQIFVDVIFP